MSALRTAVRNKSQNAQAISLLREMPRQDCAQTGRVNAAAKGSQKKIGIARFAGRKFRLRKNCGGRNGVSAV